MITFKIMGQVPSKKSSQVFIPRLKRLVPNSKFTVYKRDFGRQITGNLKHTFDTQDRLGIRCDFYVKDRITLRDIVNMEQSIWDLLQDFEVVYDDAQFYESEATKGLDKISPCVIISIWTLDKQA